MSEAEARERSSRSYAVDCHQTLQEMAAQVAGHHNLAGQLQVMATILGDPKLYEELHRRTQAKRLSMTHSA